MSILIFSLLASGFAHAADSVPVKSPTCASKIQVKSVPNGNGVYFNEDCTTAYVLPPVTATASITSIASNFNLSQCDEWSAFNNEARMLTQQMNAVTEQVNGTVAGPTQMPSFGSGPGGGVAAPATPRPLPTWTTEMKQLMASIREQYEAIRAYRERFDKIIGASATFNYEMKTQELVDAYAKANPSISHFEPLTLQNAYLSFDRVEAGQGAIGAPVLNLKVPGLRRMPTHVDITNLMPAGQQVPPSDADKALNASDEDLKETRIFGASLSGGMDLSLAGACPFYEKNKQMPSKVEGADMAAYLRANVQYTYALQAFRSYHAKYNLSILVKKIMENKTEGGFFSSKTIKSFIDDEQQNDWFTFESRSTDPRFYYPYVVQEIKASLIDRVLRETAIGRVGGPTAETGLATPNPDGASQAAKALHQCPNLYCQAAGFVLDVADSIFGSTSAVNKFMSNNQSGGEEDVKEWVMLEYYGSAGAVGR